MPEYLVSWEIELEPDDPVMAARAALRIHRDPASTAKVFQVYDAHGRKHMVDLEDETGDRP